MAPNPDDVPFLAGERLRFRGNRLAELVLQSPCSQRILMVTDGLLDFGNGGFGLSEFVRIVVSAGHVVSTAHRNGLGPVTVPGEFHFATTTPPIERAHYDQIWLFGYTVEALSPREREVIARFMAAGGGVFATGDHATIGAGMGTSVPRVRAMRNWATVPMVSPQRLDTVVDPGGDGIKQFDDQADAIAQRIYPVFFSNGGPDDDHRSWATHPVLRDPSGAVDALPDHPHESECLAPVPGSGNFAGFVEWPSAGGSRIAPQVVAVSVSAGRFITDLRKPPVQPRCFGAISVYDGDDAGVGRIVCDATWHHFVNINLNGAGATPDSTGTPRTGLYSGGAPTAEYLKIRGYYLNTVRWLAPLDRRHCWPWLRTALLRFDFDVLELQLPRPEPPPWDDLLRIGLVVEQAANRHWGPGAVTDILDDLLVTTPDAQPLAAVLRSSAHANGTRSKASHLLPLPEIRRAVLASVVHAMAAQLPDTGERLALLLRDDHDAHARTTMAEAMKTAHATLGEWLRGALAATTEMASAMTASKPAARARTPKKARPKRR